MCVEVRGRGEEYAGTSIYTSALETFSWTESVLLDRKCSLRTESLRTGSPGTCRC